MTETGRTRAAAAAGVAIGFLLVAGLRTVALGGDARFVSNGWLNALGGGVAAATLVLSWLVRAPRARPYRPGPVARAAVGGVLGTLAVATYAGLGNDVGHIHTWEHFHYYLGGKYFEELSYARFYACVAVAESERVGRDEMEGRRMRDLERDAVMPVDAALDDPAACTRRFTPERWKAFGDDVMWFREATGRIWDRMQQDHGFNPPPTWVLVGGLLARIGPASTRTQTILALVDPVLLAAMLALIGWAFGGHVLLVALVAWGCQVPGQGTWTAGSMLRQDWLFFVVASVCLARRGRFGLAGAAAASAAALRLFPVFLLALPIVVIARRTWTRGRLGAHDRRFLAGVALGGVLWLGATTAAFGVDAWRDFRRHIAVHRLAPLANHVGLRATFSQSWEGRWVVSMRLSEVDPYAVWGAARQATFAVRWPAYVALAGAIALVAAAAGMRLRRIWVALAASSVVVLAAVDVASYYCAFLIVLGLLAAASRVEEWLALAAVVASRATNALPLATENPDVRYTVQSVVLVAWALAALVLVAWRPRARVPATAHGDSRVAPSRAARRRSSGDRR
jgi:hypothetical protein